MFSFQNTDCYLAVACYGLSSQQFILSDLSSVFICWFGCLSLSWMNFHEIFGRAFGHESLSYILGWTVLIWI